jgi:short-subunit dehydrogenase
MKKAIVVGATSGIGKKLAQILVSQGYVVGITGRREELLEELKNENPPFYFIKPFDITDTQICPQKLEELVVEIGGLDLFILSSGYGEINHKLDFEIEKQTVNTNVLGFTSVVDWAFNYFEKQKYGHLVAITSIAGIRGGRFAPAYNASKSYQINYLEGLSQKASKLKSHIYITDIRPGFVDTEMAKGEGKFWVSSTEKASNEIYNALLKKKKVVYITRRWKIIALLLKLLPRKIYTKRF